MKTIQMTIDEPLLTEVDQATEAQETSRSAFIRDALREALRRSEIREMERKHKQAYTEQPVEPGEFDVWTSEQTWPEE